MAGDDAVDTESLVVPEQYGDLVVVFRGVEGYQAVAAGIVHVDNVEGEAVDQPGQHESGAVHRVGEAQEQGQVVGAGSALVGGQHHKRFGGTHPVGRYRVVVPFDFGNRRTGAPDVARRRVGQQVLAGPIEAILPGDVGGVQEGVPSELVNVRVVLSLGVGGDDTDVVTGVPNKSVNQQAPFHGVGGVGPHRVQHPD